MTTREDAKVAEIMELQVVNMNDEGDPPYYRMQPPPGYKGGVWPKLYPFLTAPTFDTDGIVLEWVQGPGEKLFGEFLDALKDVIYEEYNRWAIEKHDIAVDCWPSKKERDKAANWLVIYLHHYKPGMHAKALLEVCE